eukprot:UN06047
MSNKQKQKKAPKEEQEEHRERQNLSSGQTSTSSRGNNPNATWQKKIGRSSVENNVYEIKDIENSPFCGTSNEWYTPQASAHCSLCVIFISLIGIVLMIYSFVIDMNQFNFEWAQATCGGEKVEDKISAFQAWEYLCAIIVVTCIVGIFSSCYTFWTDKPYVIDKNGEAKKETAKWNVGNTRICCRFETFLWFFMFILIVIWFWIMVGIVSGLDFIATSKNCTPDTVQEAAGDKLLAFGFLITLSV